MTAVVLDFRKAQQPQNLLREAIKKHAVGADAYAVLRDYKDRLYDQTLKLVAEDATALVDILLLPVRGMNIRARDIIRGNRQQALTTLQHIAETEPAMLQFQHLERILKGMIAGSPPELNDGVYPMVLFNILCRAEESNLTSDHERLLKRVGAVMPEYGNHIDTITSSIRQRHS